MTERKIKRVKYTNEPVYINEEGVTEPYIHKDIVTNRDAYSASLHILFKHVSDFHLILIEIIAEKTGLDSTEIIASIQQDPRYLEAIVDPKIHSFGLLEKEDVQKVIEINEPEKKDPIEELQTKMSATSIQEKPKKPRVVRKAKV
jgi:hypothetical protein